MPNIGRRAAGKGVPLSDMTERITVHRRRREPVADDSPEFRAGMVRIRQCYARRRNANVFALKKANEDDDSTVTFSVRASTTVVYAVGDFIVHGDEVFILRRTQPIGSGVGFEALHAAPYKTLAEFQAEFVEEAPPEGEPPAAPVVVPLPESPTEPVNPYWGEEGTE